MDKVLADEGYDATPRLMSETLDEILEINFDIVIGDGHIKGTKKAPR
ncbi:hypothetical protein [Sphingobacterium siyangense]